MKVLIADDDLTYRRLLQALLTKWGYEVVVASNGDEAWRALQAKNAPQLAILDWMMPGKDGVEICQQIQGIGQTGPRYMILLTAKGQKEDVVVGLDAGADDYITKPFESEELRARVQAGKRIVGLQAALADRVKELGEALDHVKTLQGILPICMYCKKIRNDQNYWEQVESYIGQHTDVEFTHGLCPECFEQRIKRPLAGLDSDADS